MFMKFDTSLISGCLEKCDNFYILTYESLNLVTMLFSLCTDPISRVFCECSIRQANILQINREDTGFVPRFAGI